MKSDYFSVISFWETSALPAKIKWFCCYVLQKPVIISENVALFGDKSILEQFSF